MWESISARLARNCVWLKSVKLLSIPSQVSFPSENMQESSSEVRKMLGCLKCKYTHCIFIRQCLPSTLQVHEPDNPSTLCPPATSNYWLSNWMRCDSTKRYNMQRVLLSNIQYLGTLAHGLRGTLSRVD